LKSKKDLKKNSESKNNGSVGGLKIYKVNGNAKKEEPRPGREKAIKTFLVVIIVILAIAAVFAAISTFFPGFFGRFTKSGELAAKVNGNAITMERLNAEYERLPLQYQYYITKEAFLTQLIDEMLLYNEAADQGLMVTDPEVNTSLNTFIQQNNLTQEKLDEILVQKKLTMEQLKSLIKSQLVVDKLLEQEVTSKINVTQEVAMQYYTENPEAFTIPEMVTARHILVSIDNRTEADAQVKANDVFKMIKADKSNFCELVTNYSDDPGSVENCGEYLFTRNQMVPEFETAAFDQGIDNISIVKTSFGYHIVWTINKTPESVLKFEDVAEQINTLLGQQQQKMLYSDLIVSLRDKAEITNYLEQKAAVENVTEAEAEKESSAEIAAPQIEVAPTEPAEEQPAEPVEATEEAVAEETVAVSEEQEVLEEEVAPAVDEVVEKEQPTMPMSFAQCLTSKGVKLYGAYWDSSTKMQKEYFGVDAVKLTYVECGVQGDYRAQDKACEEAGIMAYPTWDIDGQKQMGIQTLSQLATLTGCLA